MKNESSEMSTIICADGVADVGAGVCLALSSELAM